MNEGILHVKHADQVYAVQAGFQEEYSLSECVWYQGYVDTIVLPSFGLILLPIHFKQGIVIFHIPTSKHIECGFTRENYDKWCLSLRDAGIHECRKISRFSPLIILLFFLVGLWLSFHLTYLSGNLCPPFFSTLLMLVLPVVSVILGCSISGYDYRVLKLKDYCVGVFLLLLFITMLCVLNFCKV